MLNELVISNKWLGDYTLPIGKLNVILGENGVGKSTFLTYIAEKMDAKENYYRHSTPPTSAVDTIPLEIERIMNLPHKTILWDLPENGLHSIMIKKLPETLLGLIDNGIQVFITTNSLFLCRELELALQYSKFKTMWFSLSVEKDKESIVFGSSIDDVEFTILDEEHKQNTRYLNSNL